MFECRRSCGIFFANATLSVSMMPDAICMYRFHYTGCCKPSFNNSRCFCPVNVFLLTWRAHRLKNGVRHFIFWNCAGETDWNDMPVFRFHAKWFHRHSNTSMWHNWPHEDKKYHARLKMGNAGAFAHEKIGGHVQREMRLPNKGSVSCRWSLMGQLPGQSLFFDL